MEWMGQVDGFDWQNDPIHQSYERGHREAMEEIIRRLPELVEVHDDVAIIDDRRIGIERITYRWYDVAYIKFDWESFGFSIFTIDRDKLKNMIKEARNG